MCDIDSNQGEGVNTLSYTSLTTSPLAFASHDLCLKTVGPKPFPLEDKLISTVLTQLKHYPNFRTSLRLSSIFIFLSLFTSLSKSKALEFSQDSLSSILAGFSLQMSGEPSPLGYAGVSFTHTHTLTHTRTHTHARTHAHTHTHTRTHTHTLQSWLLFYLQKVLSYHIQSKMTQICPKSFPKNNINEKFTSNHVHLKIRCLKR